MLVLKTGDQIRRGMFPMRLLSYFLIYNDRTTKLLKN